MQQYPCTLILLCDIATTELVDSFFAQFGRTFQKAIYVLLTHLTNQTLIHLNTISFPILPTIRVYSNILRRNSILHSVLDVL
jgi:hypothetical protein